MAAPLRERGVDSCRVCWPSHTCLTFPHLCPSRAEVGHRRLAVTTASLSGLQAMCMGSGRGIQRCWAPSCHSVSLFAWQGSKRQILSLRCLTACKRHLLSHLGYHGCLPRCAAAGGWSGARLWDSEPQGPWGPHPQLAPRVRGSLSCKKPGLHHLHPRLSSGSKADPAGGSKAEHQDPCRPSTETPHGDQCT